MPGPAGHAAFESRGEPANSRTDLLAHLQTALEIEHATIPVYLYAYYSLNRTPDTFPKGMSDERIARIKTFANRAGGVTMSVAVEEMLHLALVGNLIRALGGMPDFSIYRKPSTVYPVELPHHDPRYSPDPDAKGPLAIPLARFSDRQLGYFLAIEYPERPRAQPQGDDWDTIGQFYEFIRDRIETDTTDASYGNVQHQLAPGKGYYCPNNVDTIHPRSAGWDQEPIDWTDPSARGAKAAVYPDADDSGGLVVVRDKASALRAIDVICSQGEGNPADPRHEDDDPRGREETHWYKWKALRHDLAGFDAEELATFVFPFPENPTRSTYARTPQYDYRPLVDLANAVFTYVFQMTEASYRLSGAAQHVMFNIGMHKAMIFVLDKIINAMRYYRVDGDGTSGNGAGAALAPTFESWRFESLATAKPEMVALFDKTPLDFQQANATIRARMRDLPDVHVAHDGVVRF